MGRKSLGRSLAVWSNGQRLAVWRMPTRGSAELQYDDQWVNAPESRPLSLSLPFQPGNLPIKGQVVTHFFDNLLPDSEPIRRRLAQRHRAVSTAPFDLLRQLGRDCVGAVQLVGEDESPTGHKHITGDHLSEQQVERHLLRVMSPQSALGLRDGASDVEDDLRLCIAGAQEKTALLWHQGQWVLPRGATPTTHILKLPMGRVGNQGQLDMAASVENEWLCLRLLQAYGLRVPQAAMLRFGGQKVLGVERFDRRLHASGRWWMRLPQEDFCQARGLPPDLKYESDGGPGLQSICDILQASTHATQDLRDVLSAQIIFWMLAATDGHAKNFSIHLLRQGRFRLTPLYDVVSAWPVIGHGAGKLEWQQARLAMSVRGKSPHYRLNEIQRRHFNAMAPRLGAGRDAEALIQSLIDQTPKAIDAVSKELPSGFPTAVSGPILEGLRKAAIRLGAMPAA